MSNPNAPHVVSAASAMLDALGDDGWETWHHDSPTTSTPAYSVGFLFERDGKAVLVTMQAVDTGEAGRG